MTMILMPLTYSIAYGLVGGIGTYVVLNFWDWASVGLSRLRRDDDAVGQVDGNVNGNDVSGTEVKRNVHV